MPAMTQQDKRGRSSPGSGHDPRRRQKRGKYTSVACDECKRRKLKCLSGDKDGHCQRCAAVGLSCTYSVPRRDAAGNATGKNGHEVTALSEDVRQLRAMMGDLIGTVGGLQSQFNCAGDGAAQPEVTAPTVTAPTPISLNAAPRFGVPAHSALRDDGSIGHRHLSSPAEEHPVQSRSVPEQPRFVGATRSAYSIEIGQQALTQMGIPRFETLSPSRPQSPADLKQRTTTLDVSFWQRCDEAEVVRLLAVFQEEVESVYPCLETDYMAAGAADILAFGRLCEDVTGADPPVGEHCLNFKDFQLAKVAIATAIVIEAHGKNENSTVMVESVERSVSRILKPTCDLKDLQLLAILSIYYFHCDEDLLAWRTIGLAAREALVMGLHRKSTLLGTFKEDKTRALAVRVFWAIYVLDRRWSFGTSLSFALVDRDIDPELPEPGSDHPYLQCMVNYGRLCSSLWDAIMSFGSLSNCIPKETAADLDFKTQDWLESIPTHLQLRHPRLGLASRPQPRVLQRLRALLYLRGNHTRILIYRHHLLSPYRIKAESHNAWLVVEIAQDSIQVLVHLNETSDIYRRQQNAFNYFLLSAIAVIFLAVCHDPGTFAEACRKPFFAAVQMVRDFSRRSQASHRLWTSIKGLLPRLRRLGMLSSDEDHETEQPIGSSGGDGDNNSRPPESAQKDLPSDDRTQFFNQEPVQQHLYANGLGQDVGELAMPALDMPILEGNVDAQTDLSATTPNLFQMSNDLMTLFNAFVQGQQFLPDMNPNVFADDILLPADSIIGEEGEVARRFQGLI